MDDSNTNRSTTIMARFSRYPLAALLLIPMAAQAQIAPYCTGTAGVLEAGLAQRHISLTDNPNKAVVCRQLASRTAGYHELANSLIQNIQCPATGCMVQGAMLPLDLINGWYREVDNNPNTHSDGSGPPIRQYDSAVIQEAYIQTWWEKNSHYQHNPSLNDILSGIAR